jgi:hypothetical protein
MEPAIPATKGHGQGNNGIGNGKVGSERDIQMRTADQQIAADVDVAAAMGSESLNLAHRR